MSINLLGLIKDQLGDNIIGQAANLIGENKSSTNSAISAILPTILGSIAQKGASSNGAGSLLNMINDGNHDGSIFDNLSGLLGNGSSSSSLLNAGKALLPMIMGSRQNSVLDLIGKVTGFSKSSNSSLMSMMAPMVLGMIGRQVKKNGLNAGGLMDLLKGQQSHLSSALPKGMGSILGFANGSDYSSKKTSTTQSSHTPQSSGGGGGWLKWLLPLLLVLGLLGYFGFRTGCGAVDNAAHTVSNTATDATSTVADAAGNAANAAGDAVKSAANYTTDATGNLVDEAGNVIKKAGEFTRDAAGNLVDAAGNVVDGAGNIVRKTGDAAGGAIDAAGNAVSSAANAATNTASDAVDVAQNIFTVDASGNLLDADGNIAYKAGEFSKSDEGYYVDKNGKKIGFFKKVGKAIGKAAGKTADFFSNSFSGMFKKKEATGSTYTLSDIEWNPENHRITNFSKEEVEGLASALKANPDAKIQVQAHTNDGGNNIKNKTVSKLRAKVVQDMLVSLGVDKGQISSKGMSAKDETKAAANKIEIVVE